MSKGKGEIFWRNLVSEWLLSPLGQNEFCKIQGVSTKTFHYWKRKLSKESVNNTKSKKPHTKVDFIEVCEDLTPDVNEVKTQAIKVPRFIIIRAANGCIIEVPL